MELIFECMEIILSCNISYFCYPEIYEIMDYNYQEIENDIFST